jgi:phosphate transport system substrate-binding protein
VRQRGRWAVLQILWEQEHDAGPIPAEFLKSDVAQGAAPPLPVRGIGSDLLLALAQAWAADYGASHTEVVYEVSGGGTGVGFASFAKGEVDVVFASRRPSDAQLAAARASGNEPVEWCIGYLVSTIVVPEANPIASLSVDQLRSVFADGGEVTRWSQLDVAMPADAGDEIVPLGRPGMANYPLRDLVSNPLRLAKQPLPGDADVREVVRRTPAAIACLASTEPGDGLRVVPIVPAAGGAALAPTPAGFADGSYPLARPMWVYFRDEPSGRVKAMVHWLSSPAGKQLVARHGLSPR